MSVMRPVLVVYRQWYRLLDLLWLCFQYSSEIYFYTNVSSNINLKLYFTFFLIILFYNQLICQQTTIKIKKKKTYIIPNVCDFCPHSCILGFLIPEPVLPATVYLTTIRTLDHITRPGVLGQAVPTVVVLRLHPTSHDDLVAVGVALFADVHKVLVLVLISASTIQCQTLDENLLG